MDLSGGLDDIAGLIDRFQQDNQRIDLPILILVAQSAAFSDLYMDQSIQSRQANLSIKGVEGAALLK